MYFDSFGNLRPPKELEWYLANSIIAHLINVTVKTIADSFVYSFYERLISNLKTDIALFNSVLVWNMSLTLVRWPTRAVSYFPAVNLGDGDYELDLTDFETYYTSQCKFDKQQVLLWRKNCHFRTVVQTAWEPIFYDCVKIEIHMYNPYVNTTF